MRLENGILKALVVGPTPSMTTLGNLNIPASKISKILIKLKNNTDSDKAKLYFITDESDCWCGEKVLSLVQMQMIPYLLHMRLKLPQILIGRA